MRKKNIFILSVSSGIGADLKDRYEAEGHYVCGTFRNKSHLFEGFPSFLFCDLTLPESIDKCIQRYRLMKRPWDVFISCAGTMEPIGPFFSGSFDEWEKSIDQNVLGQLRFLHALYPLRNKKGKPAVVFFAGAGTNKAVPGYSAYTASKIFLIKMCELLDSECPDMNIFIIGPGWVRTRIHGQTMKAGKKAGVNFDLTREFLKSGQKGTDFKDIFDCMEWCIRQGRKVAGGRNFSVVHDSWKKNGQALKKKLLADPDKFKLRRYKNEGR